MSKIVLNNIYKSFGHTKVIENINLEVEQGEILSLLGESGCGKTTTLKLIAGILSPDSGDIYIGEKRINDLPIEKRKAVIVFQDYVLFPHLNIEKNVGFGLKMMGKPKDEIKSKVDEMLSLVSLEGYNKRYPHELSGGQKQRIALARALAIEPSVLLLDEPFSNLDANLKESVRDLVMSIQRKLNITTIMVTHEKEEAMMYSDKIAVMIDGKIEQLGSSMEVYNEPKTLEVAKLVSSYNLIEGCSKSNIIDLFGVKINSRFENEKVSIIVRPEAIVIDESSSIKARLIREKFAGEKKYLELELGNIKLKAVADSSCSFVENQEIGIRFLEEKLFIYEAKE